MHPSVLIAGAAALLLSAQLQAAEPVKPEVLKEVRQMALDAQKAAAAKATTAEPTEEETKAKQNAIESSRKAFFERVKERGAKVPGT